MRHRFSLFVVAFIVGIFIGAFIVYQYDKAAALKKPHEYVVQFNPASGAAQVPTVAGDIVHWIDAQDQPLKNIIHYTSTKTPCDAGDFSTVTDPRTHKPVQALTTGVCHVNVEKAGAYIYDCLDGSCPDPDHPVGGSKGRVSPLYPKPDGAAAAPGCPHSSSLGLISIDPRGNVNPSDDLPANSCVVWSETDAGTIDYISAVTNTDSSQAACSNSDATGKFQVYGDVYQTRPCILGPYANNPAANFKVTYQINFVDKTQTPVTQSFTVKTATPGRPDARSQLP